MVQDMVAYVHQRLFDPELTAAAVKEHVRAKDNNVSGQFAVHVGCGIKAYINRLRIQAAQRMIHRYGASVTEVALTVGYANVSTFSRAFRRELGLTPTAYRKEQKNEIKNEIKNERL